MMGMGIVPLFNFPPSPSPKNHLNHKNHSQDDGYGISSSFFFFLFPLTPHPQQSFKSKNHSQDGWEWVLRPLLLTPDPQNHLNQKNHSLDDGYGLFSVFLPNFK